MNRKRSARLSPAQEWGCFIAGLVFMPFIALLVPLAALDYLSREYRLRRFYRRANRLLRFDDMPADKGTLLIEFHVAHEHLGHVWWVDKRYLDLPLAAARVLNPSVDFEERLRLLNSDSARRGGTPTSTS
jgi:hypothetical protein